MDACDIDKLRELVARQHSAKHRYFSPEWGMGYSGHLDPVDVERQVVTYLSAGTTVEELTKCVEAAEKEATERVKAQRVEYDEEQRKRRIRRVCEAALQYAINTKADTTISHTCYTKSNLEEDVILIKGELDA